ncbi:MAG TPA: aminotransferase class V-fold PLP-dependent enzyme [Bryobacteraceae bacterium]|nr:aminotransferase class V-fold PLP-dependent enzyme [Bryobacteraceae bacterium]
MATPFWERVKEPWTGFSRRDLFRQGGLLAVAQALGGSVQRAVAVPLSLDSDMYRSIGVRPVINARGTFTIIPGSQTLPEVKHAMDLASRSFVDMDELMEGVGKRLAELSGAEWGIVTAGCCAAVTHCTCSAIAGGNPERMQRLPNVAGLKNEVIVPYYSHNVYDHAARMVGVKLVVVRDKAELEPAFNERTAMVYILAGPNDDGALGTRAIAEVARRKNVPVVVDAAAEILTLKPNVHLERGASAVAYSGGKCIRGPQAAGLLLGDKSLLQGAWVNSAPHHAFGRSLKVGKEEIMGMLAAVEMWVKRDHKAEWAEWESRLGQISTSVQRVAGVTAKINQPSADLSNRTPELVIQWDGAKLQITGQEMAKILRDTDPRVIVARGTGSRPGNMASTLAIVPYQMQPGDEKVVAERVYALLAKPPKIEEPPAPPAGQPATLAGQWELHLDFVHLSADHTLMLEQDGTKLMGTHHGEFASGDLSGMVAANTVRFQSSLGTEGTRVSFQFTGTAENGKMSGTVALGEYGEARWTAQKHQYRSAGRRG